MTKQHKPIYSERGFTVTSIGGMVPTQAEGVTDTGHPFYFRARWGRWTLEVGPQGAEPNYLEWGDDAKEIGEGLDDTHGCMENDAVLAILRKHFS